jgi:hypothetical protein
MTTQVTHVVVRDTPPPTHVMSVGYLYPIGQETVFKTEAPTFTSDEEESEDFVDDAEVKVVRGRRGRRPMPKGTDEAEAK